jgi:hypothetical protein
MPRTAGSQPVSSQRLKWYALVVVLTICALTTSLATRTFRLHFSPTATVRTNSAQAMRQHLDRDAVRWVAPVPVLTTLQAPTFYPRVAPAGPPLPSLFFDESLYNRPPPAC